LKLPNKSKIVNYQIVNITSRAGEAADAIEGSVPALVAEADSADAVAALLAAAARDRQSVVLRGNGTKLGWGRPPAHVDLVVSTRRLNRVVAHQHGDLTATVEAGITVAQLNHELARHGQWLPLDVSFDEATVGGTIAANDSGPLRHRHGTARDLLIGVHLATTDGRVVKAGGNVVKNVAGYDLGKLMSGSFGSLAAIVSATFKLAPLPPASSTMLTSFQDAGALARAVAAVASSQLEPAAFDIHVFVPPSVGVSGSIRTVVYQLLLRFAATAAAVAAQIEEAARLLGGPEGPPLRDDRGAPRRDDQGAPLSGDQNQTVSGAAEADAWRDRRNMIWSAPGAVLKVSWLPAALPSVVAAVEDIARVSGCPVALSGRAFVGVGAIRVDGEVAAQVAAIERIRNSADTFGNSVVLRADPAVKERIDVWGASGDTANLLRAVKRAFDPAGILNAGRGPI
jgi:glycolate oxidase FAD binding subunit